MVGKVIIYLTQNGKKPQVINWLSGVEQKADLENHYSCRKIYSLLFKTATRADIFGYKCYFWITISLMTTESVLEI